MKDASSFFTKEIEPNFARDAEKKLNICNHCSKYQYEVYSQDTGTCDVCNQTKEVANPYIYSMVTTNSLDMEKDWYGNAPRIYHYHNGFDEKKPSLINTKLLSNSKNKILTPAKHSFLKRISLTLNYYKTLNRTIQKGKNIEIEMRLNQEK